MSESSRSQLVGRGLDAIFDPALRSSIVDLIEDVRELADLVTVMDGGKITYFGTEQEWQTR